MTKEELPAKRVPVHRTREEKLRLLKEAAARSVYRVAIENQINPSQLYCWRRDERELAASLEVDDINLVTL